MSAATGPATARPRRPPCQNHGLHRAGPRVVEQLGLLGQDLGAGQVDPARLQRGQRVRQHRDQPGRQLTSRSAAGLAIPSVTISSWITVEWVSSSSDGTPHPRSTPASSSTGRRSTVLGQPGHQPQLHHLDSRRCAARWPATAQPGAGQRGAGCRHLGHFAWPWQKPRGHHRQSRRQNRPVIPLSTRNFQLFPNRYLWTSTADVQSRQISYDAPTRASSTSPSYDDRASVRVCAGSCQGGMCVTTNRSTAARAAVSCLAARQVKVGRVVVAVDEGRLAEEQVGALGQVDERVRRAGVAGVDERPPVVLDAHRLRLDGCAPARHRHGERPDLTRAGHHVDEVERLAHPRSSSHAVGAGQVGAGARPGRGPAVVRERAPVVGRARRRAAADPCSDRHAGG